ncbi:hypothetical protein [Streptosporangium sp. NPDC003464]
MPTTMSVSDLAKILFASTLQASDHPSPEQVRTVIEDGLRACHEDIASCAACVAQEAGDHPETYEARMRWALSAAVQVDPATLAVP